MSKQGYNKERLRSIQCRVSLSAQEFEMLHEIAQELGIRKEVHKSMIQKPNGFANEQIPNVKERWAARTFRGLLGKWYLINARIKQDQAEVLRKEAEIQEQKKRLGL